MTKIVVIEDNLAVREEVADILRFEGFDVAVAENGRIGVDVVRSTRPDIVLCDLMMPELDGYGTLEALRADAATASIPFVFLTARAERPDMRRAMELGADDYVVKPFTTEDLLRSLAAAMERRAHTRQASESRLAEIRDTLSATLPHELRTPLTAILGHAELLTERAVAGDPDQVVRTAKHILSAATRLNRLTDNFLLYAHLGVLARSAGRAAEDADVAYAACVERAARAAAAAHTRESDLVLQLARSDGRVPARFVEKVTEEIVDNAFKFSMPGDPVRVTLAVRDGRAELAVVDEGRGMTPEQASEIAGYVQFERQAQEQQGIGLGLGIVARIAALVGGELIVESAVERGTTVTLRLPLAPPGARSE